MCDTTLIELGALSPGRVVCVPPHQLSDIELGALSPDKMVPSK